MSQGDSPSDTLTAPLSGVVMGTVPLTPAPDTMTHFLKAFLFQIHQFHTAHQNHVFCGQEKS